MLCKMSFCFSEVVYDVMEGLDLIVVCIFKLSLNQELKLH